MKIITSLFAMVIVTTIAFGQTDDIRKKNFNVSKNIAIEGYDPVSYFDNKPVEGKSELRTEHRGIIYLFSSASNLNKFKTAPEKYEPSYGGWCAYAMGNSGEKVEVDPETYKILDGKLFLFYNSWGNNTLKTWNKNEAMFHTKADQNWKKFIP